MVRLSVIIPTLNERQTLPALLADIVAQATPFALEVIVADGGSNDGTCEWFEQWRGTAPVRATLLHTERGRARQMNAAVAAANGQDLLFLHADSRLEDAQLLGRALEAMVAARERTGTNLVAGHFGLCFADTGGTHPSLYYFFEAKTFLNRPGTINGDQGFLVSRAMFLHLGGYDSALSYMEDARFADRVFACGRWLTLPGRLTTSARRFVSEGFAARQTLNALLCTFDQLDESRFFSQAREAYREQDRARALQLLPFFVIAHRVLWADGLRHGWRKWLAVGAYACANAWQVAYYFDCLCAKRAGESPPLTKCDWLDRFDRYIARFLQSRVAQGVAVAVVVVVFYAMSSGAWLAERLRNLRRRFGSHQYGR